MHIPVCSSGRKRLEPLGWHTSLSAWATAWTGVHSSACVFKVSVNNYSADGFFKHTNDIFIKDHFYRNRWRRKNTSFRVFHGSSISWPFTVTITASWRQTGLVGQVYPCSTSTGAGACALGRLCFRIAHWEGILGGFFCIWRIFL